MLYVFSAEWCTVCASLEEVLLDEGLVEILERRVIPVKVMDRERELGANPPEIAALQERYGVTGFPTMVLQPPGDGKVRTYRGLQPASVIADMAGE